MPTPRYFSSRMAAATVSPMASRSGPLSAGQGLSSSSFWWRRCSEQSRSPRWMARPAAVAQHLDLDVAGTLEILLEIDGVVAEGGLGLGARGGECDREIGFAVGDLHAAAAAAGRRLHQHGKADLAGDRERLGLGRDAALRSRHHRDAEPLRGALGLDLVAHQADVLGLRPDEMDVVLDQDLGEAGVLGEKAVAGMHGVGAGDLAGREQGGNVEVAVARRRRPDAHALVGETHMHGIGVGGGVHGDRRNAELLAGAQDAQRDLAAIGDQDFLEHGGFDVEARSRKVADFLDKITRQTKET